MTDRLIRITTALAVVAVAIVAAVISYQRQTQESQIGRPVLSPVRPRRPVYFRS